MRLIDADNINPADVIGGASEFAADVRKSMRDLIDMQPTVYDLDAVVKRLEEQLMKREEQLKTCCDKDMEDYLRCRMAGIADATEIVKAGGVHE